MGGWNFRVIEVDDDASFLSTSVVVDDFSFISPTLPIDCDLNRVYCDDVVLSANEPEEGRERAISKIDNCYKTGR